MKPRHYADGPKRQIRLTVQYLLKAKKVREGDKHGTNTITYASINIIAGNGNTHDTEANLYSPSAHVCVCVRVVRRPIIYTRWSIKKCTTVHV